MIRFFSLILAIVFCITLYTDLTYNEVPVSDERGTAAGASKPGVLKSFNATVDQESVVPVVSVSSVGSNVNAVEVAIETVLDTSEPRGEFESSEGSESSERFVGDAESSPEHGAQLFFPNAGTVNALVIFIQHRDDRYDNELTTDPDTEWPALWSRGKDETLPAWAGNRSGKAGEALIAAPGTHPSQFDEGSISQFYHLMSGGKFTLTGVVYPRVYIPEHDQAWYTDHRTPFRNGAIRLSHEILTSREIQNYIAQEYPGDRINIFDRFTNGTTRMVPDGKFDLVVLVYRLSGLPNLIGGGSGYTSITSLGEFSAMIGDSFGDAGHPVRLGGLEVIDNIKSGSGIIAEGYTKKGAVRVIAHEIGHRQLYYAHTCTGSNSNSKNADCVGIMGGPYLTMSAPDRLKLGWTKVKNINVDAIKGSIIYQLPDALADGMVLRLRSGEQDACGDVVVEARTWSNYWDRPPDGSNDDGDHGDFFLPQEGLYLYKTPGSTFNCGGKEAYYSSLESNGKKRDPGKGFRNGSIYQAGYTPGDVFLPLRMKNIAFHKNAAIDDRLAITHITRLKNAFSFKIWNGYRED